MSDAEAMEAMLSRLSFSASLRAEQLAQEAANKLQVREVMKISLIFSVLVSAVYLLIYYSINCLSL